MRSVCFFHQPRSTRQTQHCSCIFPKPAKCREHRFLELFHRVEHTVAYRVFDHIPELLARVKFRAVG